MTLSILSNKPIPANAKQTQLAKGFGVNFSSFSNLTKPAPHTSRPQIGCAEQDQQTIAAIKLGQGRQFNVPACRFVVFEEGFNAPSAASNTAQGVSNWQGRSLIANIPTRTFWRILVWRVKGKHIQRSITMAFRPLHRRQIDRLALSDRQIAQQMPSLGAIETVPRIGRLAQDEIPALFTHKSHHFNRAELRIAVRHNGFARRYQGKNPLPQRKLFVGTRATKIDHVPHQRHSMTSKGQPNHQHFSFIAFQRRAVHQKMPGCILKTAQHPAHQGLINQLLGHEWRIEQSLQKLYPSGLGSRPLHPAGNLGQLRMTCQQHPNIGARQPLGLCRRQRDFTTKQGIHGIFKSGRTHFALPQATLNE
jgi:hypothetical protein